MINFPAVNDTLLSRARELLPAWFPNGRFQGAHEFVVGNINGDEGDSLCVDLNSGKWIDFANDTDRGGDLVSLYAASRKLTQREAALDLGANPDGIATSGMNNPVITPKRGKLQAVPDIPATICPDRPYTLAEFRHHSWGVPHTHWVYRNAEAQPLFVIARYETPKEKKIVPWTWRGGQWAAKSWPKPRPLYNLHNLPPSDAAVLLVEGEKTADAAAELFPHLVAMTWSGGASAHVTADWTPLTGRNVTIWPDADVTGRKAAVAIGELLYRLKCTVSIVDPSGWPEGWDLADAGPQDDVVSYAVSHVRTVGVADLRPQPPPKLEVMASVPQSTPTVIEGKVWPASLVETWQRYGFLLKKTSGQLPYNNHFNVGRAIAARHEQLGDMDVWFNAFTNCVMIGNQKWTDGMTLAFTVWLQKQMEMCDIKPYVVSDGVYAYAMEQTRHPVREWLTQINWDGAGRLKDLIPIGFGAERNEYTESVGRCFLGGMVARIMEPGCQVDCMPVFEGAQGAGKTRALRIIGGEYFAEVHDSIMSKDFMGSLQGKMLCEISELGAFRAADVDRIKGIISNNIDNYRAPYGKTNADHPRQCVFSATTNRDDWNTDETGARRFWPIRCGVVDTDWIMENRDQLFAEALAHYKDGEPWWKVPEHLAKAERESRWDSDPWDDAIRQYVFGRENARVTDIMDRALHIETDKMNLAAQLRIGRILKKLGFENVQKRIGEDRVRQWERKRR